MSIHHNDESNCHGAVAVVGMACRLAGGNNSPEELWKTILSKVDASTDVPKMRWEPYYRRDVRNAKVLDQLPKRGYFLDNLPGFDAAFFGISPREAEQMDPQQRLALEVTWEALERAGIPPQSLSGSNAAVFMGVDTNDYSSLVLGDLPNVEPYMGIGTAYCGVPNRISHHLNLMGPSVAVDGACASSLVSIHHGRQAITQGECRLAIVGGVNAICSPGLVTVLDRAGATSPEGSCRSFDDAAMGYGRGEGAAVVILKHLADAVEDGDNILAVLKGSASAHDGHTNGIMAPNGKAQELVAQRALKSAGVDPIMVGYVEAHATSTQLGDPTEVSAISNVYGKGRESGPPCYIGSVKPNVGHLEAGAGAVSFIKTVLSVYTGILPPQANLEKLNSRIHWEGSGLEVVRDAQEWPASKLPRYAGTCSYGYGGSVSHTIVESYKAPRPEEVKTGDLQGSQVLLLSAPLERSLARQADALASWMGDNGRHHELAAIATTLATRRGHHNHRAAIIVDSHNEAAQKLSSIANGQEEWGAMRQTVSEKIRKDVVFVFSGHGAQWAGMGKILLRDNVFYDLVARLNPIIEAELGFSVLTALQTGDHEVSDMVQALTYVVQVGLNAVLRSKGVQPTAVIGHSIGEIAASVAAGCLTPEEGAKVAAKRAKLYRQVMGLGAMIFVPRPFSEMKEALDTQTLLNGQPDVVAAIDSSPGSCVLAGSSNGVESFAQLLRAKGIKSARVRTDIAFHHPSLEALSQPLSQGLEDHLTPRSPVISIYSTSMCAPRGPVVHDIDYWCTNMVRPVRLTSAISAAIQDGFRLFLEVSTHPIISQSIEQTLLHHNIEDADYGVYHTMSRRQNANETILQSLAQLHSFGYRVDWSKAMVATWTPEVPVTSWNHIPFWRQIQTGPLQATTVHDVGQHTLLGQRVSAVDGDITLYTTRMTEQTKPFPGDHPVHGSEIVPAAVLVNTFLHATSASELSNICLRVPVTTNNPREIQVTVRSNEVKICSRWIQSDTPGDNGEPWVTHTTSNWSATIEEGTSGLARIPIEEKKSHIGAQLPNGFSIDYLSSVGVSNMGFPWEIVEHYGNNREMLARVDVSPNTGTLSPLPWDSHSWAPLLDSATSVGSTLFYDDPRLRMPASIDKVISCKGRLPPKIGYLYVERAADDSWSVHVNICDEDGNTLVRFEGMRFAEIEGDALLGQTGIESLVHHVSWPPAVYTEKPLSLDSLVLVCSNSGMAQQYIESARQKVRKITHLLHPEGVLDSDTTALGKDTFIVYVPNPEVSLESIYKAARRCVAELLAIVKVAIHSSREPKVFVLTHAVGAAQSPAALSQSVLHGLSRIVASEHPDIWGALIDIEIPGIPIEVMKYVRDADVIRIFDGIPRTARLRPLPSLRSMPSGATSRSCHKGGTYLITGGLGSLGLKTAEFLVERGARRLILVSRRPLPPRATWASAIANSSSLAPALQRLQDMECRGVTIKALALDLGTDTSVSELSAAIGALDLPPVVGVIHAAGVVEDQLILSTTTESFESVLRPKIMGALALHAIFPPGSVDYMIFFSSCGQLFGFPGQGSYAAGNAFLDALSSHRRTQGDNSVSFQWSSWRGMGMASSTEFISAELARCGITDITCEDAFAAWDHVFKYDVSEAAVLRSLPLTPHEPLPNPILADIARRTAPADFSDDSPASSVPATPTNEIPSSGPERREYLDQKIRDCVSDVLHLGDSKEVDPKVALSDMGLDSVLTGDLRGRLNKALSIKVPPTLTWNYPTVESLVGWFSDRMD